jgi:hypothetical protein
VESATVFTYTRVADVTDAVWACLLICACSTRLKLPAAFRFWQIDQNKKRVLPAKI